MAACCAILEAAQASITFNGASFPICYGPESLVREANTGLYQDCGLGAVARSLGPKGVVAFWSATTSVRFERRLSAQPWFWLRDDIPLIPGRVHAMHHIYSCSFSAAALGQRQAA